MIAVNTEAFKIGSGPTLLLAGPGTGKTYQIAKRIQYLTSEKNISPDEITVITFTTEAAASMRNKITEEGPEYIEADKRPGRISTMHSLGFTIISENLSLVGLRSNINVVDDQELRKILIHNRDEEKEHAAMVLEWVRRRDPQFDKELRDWLFTDKSFDAHQDH